MGTAREERAAAAQLPQGDIVALLLEQHARIRELFTEIRNGQGETRKAAFDGLRALLAVHEAAEELVVRPVAKKTAGDEEAEARNHEEAEEFPALVAQCSLEQRRRMGQRLSKAEHLAPTHSHPGAAGKPAVLALTGPFAAMMDKARDAMRS
ncbi:hemerythrin domain-containing protein [Streptomyces sp. NBC_01622]|uniref:hemerythrin domain-containing protein n=1 Tax=Streptomyces sp. NBC_01622 TaxID=2975903 RepID=UPI00386CAB7A|nr:hemerythrin domain-containing protein [Streptomyces sp. NBC_01622]